MLSFGFLYAITLTTLHVEYSPYSACFDTNIPLLYSYSDDSKQQRLYHVPKSNFKIAKKKKKNTRRSRKSKRVKSKTRKTPPSKSQTAPPITIDSKAPLWSVFSNLPTAPKLSQKDTLIAILPFSNPDIGENMTHEIEQTLINELDEKTGFQAVSSRDVLNDLANYGLEDLDCENDLKCLGLTGRYARAHFSLVIKLVVLGGTMSMSFQLIDTEKFIETERVADVLPIERVERSTKLHQFLIRLLEPDSFVGSLMIHAEQNEADIYLDDKFYGTTPLKDPIPKLAVGPHILRVSKSGYTDLYQFVDVVYKRNSSITVDLENTTISGVIVEMVSKTGFGQLFVATEVSDIEIRVDGEPTGVTPLDGAIPKIAAGSRRVSLRKPGLEAKITTVNVSEGQRVDLAVTLRDNRIETLLIRSVSDNQPVPSFQELIASVNVAKNTSTSSESPMWLPSWKFYTGLAIGGVGIGSFGLSSYYGLQINKVETRRDKLMNEYKDTSTSVQRAKEICSKVNSNGTCVAGVVTQNDNLGKKYTLIHLLSLGGGVACLATGATLVLWDLYDLLIGAKEQSREQAHLFDFSLQPVYSKHAWQVTVQIYY